MEIKIVRYLNKMIINDNSVSKILRELIRLYHKRAYIIFKKHDITRGQPPILSLLSKKDGRTQNEFSDLLYIEPATVTDCLQRMEKNKLIIRKQDQEDLRKTRVFLTDKGKIINNEIKKLHMIIEDQCFANFDINEKSLFKELIMKMRENLKKVEK